MTETVYLETGSLDPAYNLALEEFILRNRRDQPYLLLWQNDNTVVIGQNQNAEAEIDRAFVETHGIHVVRRITGGGAVYHDLGNLNYSFVTDVENAETITYQQFTRPVVEALRADSMKFQSKSTQSVHTRVGNIRAALKRDMDLLCISTSPVNRQRLTFKIPKIVEICEMGLAAVPYPVTIL